MSLETLIAQCLGDEPAAALAQRHAARWQAWVCPISPDAPAGTDPAGEDDFQQLRDEVNRLSGADPARVCHLAERLLRQCGKDLRVASYYTWARTQQHGESGLADGLELVGTLIAAFGRLVLPARAPARVAALQWLAGDRVLDALSRFPELAKEQARRTVAALAWIDEQLVEWPAAERPCLAPLHTALSHRLGQAGGLESVLPQRCATPPTEVPATQAIASGRDALARARELAAWLQEQPDGWLAAHRLLKHLRWDTLQQPPLQDLNGQTQLAAPREHSRALLARLHQQRQWQALLVEAQNLFAEGVNHFWLDLQWYLHQALQHSPAPYSDWAWVIEQDLALTVRRLPGIEALCWGDGTPFAHSACRDWIAGFEAAASSELAPAAGVAGDHWQALEQAALALADAQGLESALKWLAEQTPCAAGRDQWLRRALEARIAEQCGKPWLAIDLYTELLARAQSQGLALWEPMLLFDAQARLLRLLRGNASRIEADEKPRYQARQQALQASLSALDPARAAVLYT
ncbi:type VI secretion system protein TssA [Pseudomonas sp. KNUC1026]|uniref:type VI secretion system protein TssA n=1 Tax=Pseudomonas sp. KNUC1026 TaxID=2893890 RepID=UPI001F40E73F|nr:type VI secretion system protein TssA [Pseudomonas sp. KNUC1026]UFH51062.1 type VI secretion system protein TssA [Pseudomonas sp. KNUC1026]